MWGRYIFTRYYESNLSFGGGGGEAEHRGSAEWKTAYKDDMYYIYTTHTLSECGHFIIIIISRATLSAKKKDWKETNRLFGRICESDKNGADDEQTRGRIEKGCDDPGDCIAAIRPAKG